MKQQATITITAIVEYDDTKTDLEGIETLASITFLQYDKYTGEEIFYPKLESVEIIDYQDTTTIKIDHL